MTEALKKKLSDPAVSIVARPAPAAPVFVCGGPDALALRAGTVLNIAGTELAFEADLPIDIAGRLQPGTDIMLALDAANRVLALELDPATTMPVLGGFHYAPGGNATARAGGDEVPAVNPCSIWDVGFRPACADPRGMAYVAGVPGSAGVAPFWADIYLCASDHLAGTSRFGATIADGGDPPEKPGGGKRYARFDYETAQTVLAHHGKGLLSFAEFAAAAYGVTERSAAGRDPKTCGLDAPRTSRCGVMQASGNLYVWGHDGDPDSPRASRFGGYWGGGEFAGSRYADVGHWPDYSSGWIGARGRSDHLQPDA
jgi:hypothetical protein